MEGETIKSRLIRNVRKTWASVEKKIEQGKLYIKWRNEQPWILITEKGVTLPNDVTFYIFDGQLYGKWGECHIDVELDIEVD